MRKINCLVAAWLRKDALSSDRVRRSKCFGSGSGSSIISLIPIQIRFRIHGFDEQNEKKLTAKEKFDLY
jgi:hypothetical protein